MVMKRAEKEERVEELSGLIDSYSTTGIVNLEKIPAAVQLRIKNNLKDNVVIRMSRKNVLLKALQKSKKYNEEFAKKLGGSCAMLFSNENPFRLFKMLKQNTVKAGAKTGQTAPKDIIIPKGPTPIPPGPAISTFQKAGLKTKVEAGKISVIDEKAVVKAGEQISSDVVSVLNLLKIEPIEISITMGYAFEDGIIYSKEILDINTEDILNDLTNSIQKAINLSVNTGYPTKLSIEIMLQKAYTEAKNLAVEADIIEKEFIGDVLAKAIREKNAIESVVGVM